MKFNEADLVKTSYFHVQYSGYYQAVEEKEKGNAAYKKKDFEAALAHYAKAIELDPTNITFRTNRAGTQLFRRSTTRENSHDAIIMDHFREKN